MNEAHCPQFQNEASPPAPVVKAEFHVEPHPDPVVRALILEVERLREENSLLRAQLEATRSKQWR